MIVTKHFLNKKSLFDLLDRSINESSVPVEFIQKINTELRSLLTCSLDVLEWSMEHFLSLAIGLYFIEKISEPNYVEDDDPYYQGRNTLKAIPKSVDDIKKMFQDAMVLYQQKFEILQSAIVSNEITNPSLPIEWLELAQKTKGRTSGTNDNSTAIFSDRNIYIPNTMAAQIRYNYYKVDANIAEDGVFPVSRYSVNEAAKEIGESIDELIADCFKNDFGIYLKKGKFKIRQFIHSPITRSSISSDAEFSYIHHYKGHLRLMKSSFFYPDATLEKIYQGGIIEVSSRDTYALVPIQPSVAQCSQGLSVYIELRRGETITLDDFVLIKNEIDQYKAKRQHVTVDGSESVKVASPSSSDEKCEQLDLSQEKTQETISDNKLVGELSTIAYCTVAAAPDNYLTAKNTRNFDESQSSIGKNAVDVPGELTLTPDSLASSSENLRGSNSQSPISGASEALAGIVGTVVGITGISDTFPVVDNLAVIKESPSILEISDGNIFSRKGVVYEMRYDGIVAHTPIRTGEQYIEQLLKNPRKDIDAILLVRQRNFNVVDTGYIENSYELVDQGICDSPFTGGSHQPVYDGRAMAEIKQRLKEIDDEIKESTACDDIDAIEQLKNEKEDILETFSANMKLNKQSRTFSTPAQQARQSVRQNINKALKRIEKIHPKLHQHLILYIKTGSTCQYSPPEDIIWC